MADDALGNRPAVSEELLRCIYRLSKVRQELSALKTEEDILRTQLEQMLGDWPDTWFPIRADGRELRRYARVGTVDPEAARRALTEAGVWSRVPREMRVVDAQAAERFVTRVAELGLGARRFSLVAQWFQEAVAAVPEVSVGWLERERKAGGLADDTWRRCFRRGQPRTWVWTVR